MPVGDAGPQPKLRGSGMFHDIVQGFLDDEKQIVAQVGGKFMQRNLFGKIQPATDARSRR